MVLNAIYFNFKSYIIVPVPAKNPLFVTFNYTSHSGLNFFINGMYALIIVSTDKSFESLVRPFNSIFSGAFPKRLNINKISK